MFCRKQSEQNLIMCNICCCELNTQKALDIHNESPKHKKKEASYSEIMEMKTKYKELLENKANI